MSVRLPDLFIQCVLPLEHGFQSKRRAVHSTLHSLGVYGRVLAQQGSLFPIFANMLWGRDALKSRVVYRKGLRLLSRAGLARVRNVSGGKCEFDETRQNETVVNFESRQNRL